MCAVAWQQGERSVCSIDITPTGGCAGRVIRLCSQEQREQPQLCQGRLSLDRRKNSFIQRWLSTGRGSSGRCGGVTIPRSAQTKWKWHRVEGFVGMIEPV